MGVSHCQRTVTEMTKIKHVWVNMSAVSFYRDRLKPEVIRHQFCPKTMKKADK